MSKKETKKEKIRKKFRKMYGWKLITITLFALLLISIFSGGFEDFFKASAVGSEKATGKAVDFINTNLLQGLEEIVLEDVSETAYLYKMNLNINGQKFESYVTKDGRFLFPGEPIDMEQKIEEIKTPVTTGQTTTEIQYSNEDFVKIESFVNCLAEKGFRIYGANWCGWTTKLVTSFGGFDKVAPIYVECSEQEAVCSQEGIRGYPTIKVDGEPYQGKREFIAFAQATGCKAPSIETSNSETVNTAVC